MLLGNHEFFHDSYTGALSFWTDYFDNVVPTELGFTNVNLLHMKTFDVDHVRFIGTTLWSHLSEQDFGQFQATISDFRNIRPPDQSSSIREQDRHHNEFSPHFRNMIHLEQVQWIRAELERARLDGKRIVLLSHHAPTKHDLKLGNTQTTHPLFHHAFRTEVLKGNIQERYGDIIEYCCFGQ